MFVSPPSIWCGNMNLLNGLLPTRRIMMETSNQGGVPEGAIDEVEKGIHEAFRFLTSTSGYITKGPAFVPTRTSQWAAGNMYELCDEYLRQIGEDVGVRQSMNRLVLGSPSTIVNCFHRNNASAATILHCDEFRNLDPKPDLPWDSVPLS